MKNKNEKKNINKILLKGLLILLGVDVILIPLCYLAEVKPMVGLTIFILIPLVLAIFIVLLSRNCFNSYEKKKKAIEEKLKR